MDLALIADPPIRLSPGVDYDLNDGRRYSHAQIQAMTEAQRNAKGVATIVAAPPRNPHYRVNSEALQLVEGRPAIVQKTQAISIADRQSILLGELADKRWGVENGGILIGMARIATDDRSKMLIMAARSKAKEDASYTTRWKVASGQFVTLDAPTLIAFGEAVEAHVSACFAREEALSDEIAAAKTHAALDAIDINSGWPE